MEFAESRARHAAGERTLAEVEAEEQFELGVEDRELAPVDSVSDLFNIAA
jgi:hypothetical protein